MQGFTAFGDLAIGIYIGMYIAEVKNPRENNFICVLSE